MNALLLIAIGICMVAFFMKMAQPESRRRREEREENEYLLLERKRQAEDLIWNMTAKQLVLVDRNKIFPEHVELLNQRILDHIEAMSPTELKKLRPYMLRYNDGFLEFIDMAIDRG